MAWETLVAAYSPPSGNKRAQPTRDRQAGGSARPGQTGRRARPARDRQAGALSPPGRAADATSALALLSAKSP